MGGIYRLIRINRWNRTRDSIKKRNIRVAIRARAKCKIGEERGLACEKLQKKSWRTCHISHQHFVILSGKKQMLEHTTDANLLVRQKNRHEQMQACMTWQV